MIFGYSMDPNEPLEEAVPDSEAEFFNAKTFLQTASVNTGDNLYDHLTEVLNKILAERPENIIDFFEEYSRKVKEQRFRPLTDHLEDMYIIPATFDVASKMMLALQPLPAPAPSTIDPEDLETADMSKNNMLEMLYYLEQAGLGLPRREMVYLMLSMRKLTAEKPISSIRFWGKIFGSFKNYFVLETELKEEEYIKRNERFADEVQQEAEGLGGKPGEESMPEFEKSFQKIMAGHQDELEGEAPRSKRPRQLPVEPQINFQEPKEPPMEPSGVGLNKKVYFVCTNIGEPWIELPDVTPRQIRVARQICKSFTGDLEKDILTYPEFPGQEKNYLRAQITRISSATQIAPMGYYTFGGDEEMGEGEEDEGGEEAPVGENRSVYRINPKYDPPALKDLLDPSMGFWVHTEPYILPQGRSSWWNPGPEQETVEDEAMGEELGEEEEDESKEPKAEAETGPPLLTPLSEDASLETTTAWTARTTFPLMDMYSAAVVRSSLWPGGFAMSTPNKSFYNVYFGFGLKFTATNFSPTPLPAIQQEYPDGPEILEVLDPTGAEEEKWRIDHLPVPKPEIAEGGEEAEGEQEEEEDEEDEEEEDD